MLSTSTLLPVLPFLSLLTVGMGSAATKAGSTYTSPKTSLTKKTTLADGSSYVTGSISNNLLYDASGKMLAGGCGTIGGITPESCYHMSLTATGEIQTRKRARRALDLDNSTDPTLLAQELTRRTSWTSATPDLTLEERAALNGDDLDAYFEAFPEQAVHRWASTGGVDTRDEKATSTLSARSSTTSQRNEIYTWPGAASGETWEYEWTTFMPSKPSTSAHFFHSWQILRRDASGGPVVTLDWKVNKAVITDAVVGCTGCVVEPIAGFVNTPTYHSLNITYGVDGSIAYRAWSDSSDSLIEYSASHDMGSSGSLKMGAYRQTVSTNKAFQNFVMNYSGKRVK